MEVASLEYVKANPLLPISASLFTSLAHDDQKAVIGQLIDGAVYCDSWEAYFSFALNNGIPINDDVAFEAVQAVGLDPVSTQLWITAAGVCSTDESKRELYHLALSIPLYNRAVLVKEYTTFEQALQPEFVFEDVNEMMVHGIVSSEKWPDRYVDLSNPTMRRVVRQQWIALMDTMTRNLSNDSISPELQVRRMDLAYRQMCVQLASDDSCWYEYAMFQLNTMEDQEGAVETIEAGLSASGGVSFCLNNLMASLRGERTTHGHENQELMVVDERAAARKLAEASESGRKDALRQLRSVGKSAAQEGVHDWKVYSQWHAIESAVVKDSKMASKVLENGMICCSTSPSDATLLGNEAIKYHLIQRHDREALGYAEQQVEQATQTHHVGRRRAAWNALVSTENQLGLSFSKAEVRRGEEFPQSQMQTFLERYRVGSYLPCAPDTVSWLQFVDDYALEKRQEKEAPFKDMVPARSTVLCPALALARLAAPEEPETVDESQWASFTAPPNPFATQATAKLSENPDEIVGSRELRGRWAYRVKLDKQTEARLRREERIRRARATGEDVTSGEHAQTPMGVLVQRIKAVPLTDSQATRLKTISVDWIINQLVSSELDLRDVLTARAASQAF